MNCCESQTRVIAARISPRKGAYCLCKSSNGTRMWAFDDASAAGLGDTALVIGAMQKQTISKAKLDCSLGQKTGPQSDMKRAMECADVCKFVSSPRLVSKNHIFVRTMNCKLLDLLILAINSFGSRAALTRSPLNPSGN